MRKIMEDLAAAAALAEGGLDQDAQDILVELRVFRKSPGAKFIFVTDKQTLPDLVSTYVSNLAKRLSGNLLVIARTGQDKAQKEQARQNLLQSLRKGAGDLQVTCVTARGNVLELARIVSEVVRGVEFILLHDAENEEHRLRTTRPLRVPIFHVGAEGHH